MALSADAVAVQAGDALYFQLNRNANNCCDTTLWNPLISYLDIEGMSDLNGGSVSGVETVAVSTGTIGAEVRYTLDGTEPTTSSTLYAGPFTVGPTTTVKVKGFKADYNPSVTKGRLGAPVFSAPSGTYNNDLDLVVAAAPGGSQLKVLRSNPNSLDSSVWALGTQGNQGGYAFYASGTTDSENRIDLGINPYGQLGTLWAAYADGGFDADGGWDTADFPLDKSKMYRFSVWMRKTGGMEGASYLGCDWASVSDLTGSPAEAVNNNPYFWVGGLPLDQWCLVVGYVHPAGDTSTTSYSKVYDSTGAVVANGTDFKWLNTTTASRQRAYLYYCANPDVRQYFWDPRVEVVDSPADSPALLCAPPVASPQTMALAGNSANVVESISYSSDPNILSSSPVSRTYHFKVSTPSVVPIPSGDQVTVTVNSSIGASIHYTTDGSDPTPASLIYTGPLTLAWTATSRWRAFKTNYVDSDIVAYPTPGDSDNDGLPDWWELLYFGNLDQTGSGDFNGDGVSNYVEFKRGRNPLVPAVADTGGNVNLILYSELR